MNFRAPERNLKPASGRRNFGAAASSTARPATSRAGDAKLPHDFLRALDKGFPASAELIGDDDDLDRIFRVRGDGREAQGAAGVLRVAAVLVRNIAGKFGRAGDHVVFDDLPGHARRRVQLDFFRSGGHVRERWPRKTEPGVKL